MAGEVVFDPVAIPHAWLITAPGSPGGFVITAAGPVPKTQLTAAVSSVRPD